MRTLAVARTASSSKIGARMCRFETRSSRDYCRCVLPSNALMLAVAQRLMCSTPPCVMSEFVGWQRTNRARGPNDTTSTHSHARLLPTRETSPHKGVVMNALIPLTHPPQITVPHPYDLIEAGSGPSLTPSKLLRNIVVSLSPFVIMPRPAARARANGFGAQGAGHGWTSVMPAISTNFLLLRVAAISLAYAPIKCR